MKFNAAGRSAAILAGIAGFLLCIESPDLVQSFWPLLVLFGALAAGFAQSSMELGFEYSIFFISLPCLHALGAVQPAAMAMAPVLSLILAAFHPNPWAVGFGSVTVAAASVWIVAGGTPSSINGADILALLLGLAVPVWYTAVMVLHPGRSITEPAGRAIDVLLCSYSGNTAHFTEAFAGGAREAGAAVRIHRFHYAARFRESLDGDALVLAFPVIGWKPPWPYLDFLIRHLPEGKGRPAFILYTSAGGPENTPFLVWLILACRGYRVAGRAWGVYPVNFSTVRLGPRSMWKRLDRMVTPGRRRLDGFRRTGAEFARGLVTGLPFILWPFPLFLAGLVLENRWVDMFFSHNHVFRKRCDGCGMCVRYCPMSRLRLVRGFPRSRGECALCFGCVNICPHDAMQLWMLTEFGQPYRQFQDAMGKMARMGEGTVETQEDGKDRIDPP